MTLAWYDYLFKGVQNEFAGKPVKIFVMGANQWRDEDDWPLARAQATKYFLHSSGKANSLRGDGSLSTTAPKCETADTYTYDPANPAPTIGGLLCCDGTHMPPGPRDQRPVEARDDVLIYSTPPLAADLEVTGPVTLELYAKSSAVDTDFTAKLVDVWPNGFAQNLTDGILRARYRESMEKPELLNPGPGLQADDRRVVHEQCVQERPQDTAGGVEQQFPAIRSESEHRRGQRAREALRRGDECRPSRRGTSVGSHAARYQVTNDEWQAERLAERSEPAPDAGCWVAAK